MLNANNQIGGIRSSDSLTQEAGHRIIASGQLGTNSLSIVNDGFISTNPAPDAASVVPLIIDPTGGSTRSSPGFINRNGTLEVGAGFSELRLENGYFQFSDASSFGFAATPATEEQKIVFQDVRIENFDPMYINELPDAPAMELR